jgi:hypothetical protein
MERDLCAILVCPIQPTGYRTIINVQGRPDRPQTAGCSDSLFNPCLNDLCLMHG